MDFELLKEMATEYGVKILLAVVTLIIGLWIIKVILKAVNKSMKKSKVDKTVVTFLNSFISIALKAVLFISIASMLGVKMSSFIAILGAAGLAIGLALQGSLANFAGGVLILIFKPFEYNDVIKAKGYTGKVREIQILYTILITRNNEKVIIPNGELSHNAILNYSYDKERVLDLTYGIGYDDDIIMAKKIIEDIAKQCEYIRENGILDIGVSEHGGSSINIRCRFSCDYQNYWKATYDMNEKVKYAFDEAGISIPYPQTDVHLFNEK
ncbi:MAG: mechanosensitive ion channel family protein [Fusobacteriota bacterium]